MKIYKSDGNGRLDGVQMLPRMTTDSVFVSEGYQMYVLLEDPERGSWTTATGERVSLWNTHATGELRWWEPSNGSVSDSFLRLSSDALLAAKHFSLCPAILTQEEWLRILNSYAVRIESLSEAELQMLNYAAADANGEGKCSTGSHLSSAIYRMKSLGLVNFLGSASFNGETTEWFRITARGRQLLRDGAA